MRRNRAWTVAAIALAVACAGAWVAFVKLRPKPGPFHVALWYWHTPFEVPAADLKTLKSLGIDTLYVRAGTFTVGEKVTMMLPQTWRSKSQGLHIHLVFPCDAGVIRHFEDLSIAGMAGEMARWVQRCASQAETAGVHVDGVQFDFDCPTRLLPKYADLVHRCRGLLAKRKWVWSVTALPTWLGSDKVSKLAREVDFMVPQYYEGAIGKGMNDLKPIAQPASIEDGMRRAARLGTPFWVGLPSYGRSFMFDERGRMLGVYHGLSVRDALRHPSFKLERTYTAAEDVIVLKAVRAAADGRGLGYRLVYLLPTPPTLSAQIETVRRGRPATCRGVVLFRYPEPGESMCLPFASVTAALKREALEPKAITRISAKPNPWGLIDTGRQAVPASDVAFTFELGGNTPTAACDDALVVILNLDRAGIESLEPGDFDVAEAGRAWPDGAFERTGMARATAVRLVRFHMLPGEAARLGALQTAPDGASSIEGTWTMKVAGGAKVFRGEIPRKELRPKGGPK